VICLERGEGVEDGVAAGNVLVLTIRALLWETHPIPS
jgi:hypothetical protein